MTHKIFVFGSNLKGIHGAGAALHAKLYHGAIQGIGYGRMGSSFAIPTKETPYISLPLSTIEHYVDHFIDYTSLDVGDTFFEVTPIGCGLAGYTAKQIAPFFKRVFDFPTIYWNVKLPEEFLSVLNGMTQESEIS